ncbi:MAG: dTDP-4-dehydrorhamnose 3,5-epimerase [Bacteroidetes bacterium]|nr:dTDP-4-dehydrorhamnose 3,5-epimerase [Bacteroidota bacterium]
MQVERIAIEGPLILTPKVFFDERGYFYESFNKNIFKEIGIDVDFVQDNQSLSEKGILRGLHFQNPPFAQGKLVRVIKGAVLDVAVDIRKSSPTYGQHYKVELTEDNFKMFWVPPGFAHGFLTLTDNTIFSYKCTNIYNKASEGGLQWNDPDLNIDWGIEQPKLSDKDTKNSSLKEFQSEF